MRYLPGQTSYLLFLKDICFWNSSYNVLGLCQVILVPRMPLNFHRGLNSIKFVLVKFKESLFALTKSIVTIQGMQTPFV